MEKDAVYGHELSLLIEGKFGVPHDALEQVMSRTASALWFDGSPATRKEQRP